MPFGYNGRVLHVDLGSGGWEVETPSAAWYRRHVGGGCLASYYLLESLPPGVDPLSDQNVLVFASNVTSGVPISGFSRYTVTAKSPLTGAYGESEAGGYWGPELKFAGYDAIVVRGRARRPVYLWIHDGAVEVRDAHALWGLENGPTLDGLRAELNDTRLRAVSIGPAGERLIPFANVSNDLIHFNGRTGMGAVMGAKRLKAIAVRGENRPTWSDPEGVKRIAQWHNAQIKAHPGHRAWKRFGTAAALQPINQMGILPTRNFREGVFEGAVRIDGEAMAEQISVGTDTCYACAVRCKRRVAHEPPYEVDPRYGGPEYEALAALGSLCGVDNLAAIARGNQRCNALGMDVISTGAVIAFAMECFEEGILTPADTGGETLRFGDADAMLGLIETIGLREGLGGVLALGVKRAAEKIGRGAERFAFHIKGQEIPMHDPRGKTGVGLGYATSATGADHLRIPHDTAFQGKGAALLEPLGLQGPVDPLDLGPSKVHFFVTAQRVLSLYNSIGVCNFVAAPVFTLSLERLVEAVAAITGWDVTLSELLRVGERAIVMARVFNLREGIAASEDRLFRRLHEPLPSGPLKGRSIEPQAFEQALGFYYQEMGWDSAGRPTAEKLTELDLEWLQTQA